MSDGSDERDGFEPDSERARLLRETAEDVRGQSSESEQLAAILYRVSDLYDAEEETNPQEIYIAVRNILNVKERGGLGR